MEASMKGSMWIKIKKGAFVLALVLAISPWSRAQTLTPLSPDAVPPMGTFYSAQGRPPSPFDWFP